MRTPFAVVFLLLSPSALGTTCPTDGQCHLPRLVPAESTPFDEAGRAVSLHEDRAVIAAPAGGAIYAYERTDGVWAQTQRIAAPASSGGGFGTSLALDAERLVVGDPSDSTMGASAGAVHVYEQVGGSWSLAQTLFHDAAAAGDQLGASVAMSAPRIVAGAPGDAVGGRVHVFREWPAGFSWWGSLSDFATGTTPEAFGSSVAIEGKWVVIGDPLSDTHAVDTGAIFLFELTEIFSFFQDLVIPPALVAGDRFGGAVAFGSDRVVVGARGDDQLGASAGAAYVLTFDEIEVAGHELHVLEKLLPCGAGAGELGAAVSIDGDRVAIGAPGGAGSAFVFRRVPGAPETWVVENRIDAGDGAPGDAFGAAVAIDGDHVLAGAPMVDAAGADSGAGYLVSLTPESAPGGECPCDVLASSSPFGAGKPGTHGVPSLSLDPLVVGESADLALRDALAGAAPLLLWGTTPGALPFDGGELYVADLHVAPMPVVGAAGEVAFSLSVPAQPALCGFELVLQALLVDPAAAGPLHTAQSNGVLARVGT